MRLVTRYLFRHCAGVSLLCLVLGAGLVYLLQLLRLGHHLAGAFSLGLLARAFLYSLPTLLLGCLPLALAAGLLFGLGRLSDRGELEALGAAGASPLRLARAPLLLALAASASAGLLARVEPAALDALARLVTASSARALWLAAAPRRFHELGEATVFFDARRVARTGELELEGLLLALDEPPMVAVARSARIAIDGAGAARIRLTAGELQSLPSRTPRARRLRRMTFESASLSLDLRPTVQAHLGFLGGLGGHGGWGARAAREASSCLTLAVLVLALALGSRRSGLSRAGIGLGLTAGYAILGWGAAVLGGLPGALLLDGVLIFGGGLLLRGGRAATC